MFDTGRARSAAEASILIDEAMRAAQRLREEARSQGEADAARIRARALAEVQSAPTFGLVQHEVEPLPDIAPMPEGEPG